MRVSEVTEFGGPEVLRDGRAAVAAAGSGELVVEIAATNDQPDRPRRAPGAHRRRMPDLEPPFVPGWDLAGVASGSAITARPSRRLVVG